MGVAGEHLVAQREAVEGHDQRDAHLLAVGSMIAASSRAAPADWPPPRLRSRCSSRRTAAPRSRPRTARRTRRDRCASSSPCARSNMIERAVEPILVDLLVPELQQIAKRRAPVPVLGDVQLARRLAQPRRHQHRRHLRPGTRLLAYGSSRSHRSPQAPSRATAQAPNTHRRTGASARCARPSAAPAPSDAALPSSNSAACSGAPIRRRANARASMPPCSSSSPRCATVCWITRRPTRTLRTRRQ